MKKNLLLCAILFLSHASFSQKAKKTSYDFKQEILPTKLLAEQIQSFDFIITYTAGVKSQADIMSDKLLTKFGVTPLTVPQQLLKRTHFDQLRNSFKSLKYKDNKSYGIQGMTSGTNANDQHYKNLDIPTSESDLTIKIEFANYDMVGKELKENTYDLKLAFPSAKLSITNNKTKEILEELLIFSNNVITFNFPLSYNTPSAPPLAFPNKLALDNGLNTALETDLDEKIKQFLFNSMIKEVTSYIDYNYNFNNSNTTFYFAYPKNEKLIEYKNAVNEMEAVTDLISKNSKMSTHLNWNDKVIRDKVNLFIGIMENGLKLFAEKGKELEISDEIAEGFKLNLVSAYSLVNNFDKADKLALELKQQKSAYFNEAESVLKSINKTKTNISLYSTLYSWN